MCDAVGHPVRRLVRTRIGPVSDPHLKPGTWRALDGPEVRALGRAARPRGGGAPPGRARREGPGQGVDPPGGRTGPG
jgi:23S rRNA pseudouridine2605 synthase